MCHVILSATVKTTVEMETKAAITWTHEKEILLIEFYEGWSTHRYFGSGLF